MHLIKHYYQNKLWLDEYERMLLEVKNLETYDDKIELEQIFLLFLKQKR